MFQTCADTRWSSSWWFSLVTPLIRSSFDLNQLFRAPVRFLRTSCERLRSLSDTSRNNFLTLRISREIPHLLNRLAITWSRSLLIAIWLYESSWRNYIFSLFGYWAVVLIWWSLILWYFWFFLIFEVSLDAPYYSWEFYIYHHNYHLSISSFNWILHFRNENLRFSAFRLIDTRSILSRSSSFWFPFALLYYHSLFSLPVVSVSQWNPLDVMWSWVRIIVWARLKDNPDSVYPEILTDVMSHRKDMHPHALPFFLLFWLSCYWHSIFTLMNSRWIGLLNFPSRNYQHHQEILEGYLYRKITFPLRRLVTHITFRYATIHAYVTVSFIGVASAAVDISESLRWSLLLNCFFFFS